MQLSAAKQSYYITELERLTYTLSRFPFLKKAINKKWDSIAQKKGIDDADSWLTNFKNNYLKLAVYPLTVESNDREIKDAAEAMAKKCERAIQHEIGLLKKAGLSPVYRMQQAAKLGKTIALGAGARFEISDEEQEDIEALAGKLARLCAAKWWRRQLRTIHARQLETAARKLDLVNKRSGGYVSKQTLYRRIGQRQRNRDLIERVEAVNNNDQCYTLAELSDLGVSNPINRRNELMTRISGFEECADNGGQYQALLLTATAPARFHSHAANGRQYEKWDGSNPRDAQAWLCERWELFRAAIARENLQAFGFRIAEPHHDGCPHWHLLLWVPKNRHEEFYELFNNYWLESEGDEKGAKERRTDCVVIEPIESKRKTNEQKAFMGPMRKQTATGYVSKYVSKNIDGLGTDNNAWSADSVRTALRVEAWASTWGIRQFQQIGGAPVTVWRELRRITREDADCVEIEEIREAADSGNWSEYTEKMGGAICPRKDRPIHIDMFNRKKDGEIVRNEYGEIIRAIKGLIAFNWLPIKTRLYEWKIRTIAKVQKGVERRISKLEKYGKEWNRVFCGPPRPLFLGF